MKRLDYETLVALNESSVQEGRAQNLAPERVPRDPQGRFPVNLHIAHVWGGKPDVRMSVVLTPGGQTAWLDVSPEEFAAIEEVEVSELEWEAAVCAGTPPSVP